MNTKSKTLKNVTGLASLALVLGAVACAPAASGDVADTTDGAIVASPASVVRAFDATKGELPEGLAIRDRKAYVGFAPTSEIVTVDLETGRAAHFGALPKAVPDKGFMTGLAFDRAGTLHAALVSFVPEVQAGIYTLGANGGDAKLLAKHAEMPFPNGIAFDAAGVTYVSDSTGAIFVVKGGAAEKWTAGDLLTGDRNACRGGTGVPFDVGANGIAIKGSDVYVGNNDKGTILRVPILANGSAGEPVVFAGPDCDALGGADGIALDPGGDLVIAINGHDAIARVRANGDVRTIASKGPLDFPASLAFADDRALYATSFALLTASTDHAHPALVRVNR